MGDGKTTITLYINGKPHGTREATIISGYPYWTEYKKGKLYLYVGKLFQDEFIQTKA